jgi:rRNA maturation RNase YbeY
MILNKQKKVRLATRPLREFLRKTQRELKIADSEITIAFVTDAEIAYWNETYRNKKGPTDVLSFPATSGAIHAPAATRSRVATKDGATSTARRSSAKKNAVSSAALRQSSAKNGSNSPAIPGDFATKHTAAPDPPEAYSYSRLATHHLPLFLGDIAIAPKTAQRYAKKNGRSLQTEIRVLMLHGVLHLMGYDHESDTGQMDRIEQKLRRRLRIA